MKSLSLIHTSWLKPFADYFAERRVSLHACYRAANIEEKQVTTGDGWVTKQQLYRFLNAIAEGERLPEVGFLVGDTMTPHSIGAIGREMAGSETLGDAIRVFCRLINRHSEENHAWLAEGDEDGEVWLFNRTTNPFPANRDIADHAGLMSLVNLVRLAAGSDWYPAKATLQTEPTIACKKVTGLRGAEFRFRCPATGLAFPSHWLLHSIRLDPNPPPAEAGGQGRGLLEHDESIVEKLKRLLRKIVGVGGMGPTVRLMAELCDTSPRTLHRRLRECGVSYQALLDEVRLDRAKTLLTTSDLPVKEIAFELGYSGPNNFVRAFKRFTGVTPTAYRKSIQPSGG